MLEGAPDREAVVTEQMIKLDKSKLPCIAAAVKVTSPHTHGASAE